MLPIRIAGLLREHVLPVSVDLLHQVLQLASEQLPDMPQGVGLGILDQQQLPRVRIELRDAHASEHTLDEPRRVHRDVVGDLRAGCRCDVELRPARRVDGVRVAPPGHAGVREEAGVQPQPLMLVVEDYGEPLAGLHLLDIDLHLNPEKLPGHVHRGSAVLRRRSPRGGAKLREGQLAEVILLQEEGSRRSDMSAAEQHARNRRQGQPAEIHRARKRARRRNCLHYLKEAPIGTRKGEADRHARSVRATPGGTAPSGNSI
mmetsp:Transcript_133801/g.333998  ORF Transcript_133801/g.333998 Transcript_133801/m.333998 type:complete len:260 (-) Transcript_133801:11-790(-)